MSWALEEYCEDAFVSWLNSKLPANLLAVYTAWTDTEIKFPCVVVHCGKSGNVTGQFNGVRRVEVMLAVMSEAITQGSSSARVANRTYRNAVIDALAQTNLESDLNGLSPTGVVFSHAEVGDITRSVEEDKRIFVSEITVNCIAAPKTTA